MLVRRVVPAIVATLAVYAGLAVTAGGFLREHYLTPLVTTSANVPGTAWVIGQWWTKDGRFAFAPIPLSLLNQFCSAPPTGKGETFIWNIRAVPRPARLGAVEQLSWRSRFWPFQWIEGGWLLALSALLIAAAIWLVQRRAA